jgi:carboxylate-amine ligase
MLEVNTPPCPDLSTAERELRRIIRRFQQVAQAQGCVMFAAGLHPFSKVEEQVLFPDPRYKRILRELQIVGRRLITQGLHCHVGLPDADTCIRVLDKIRVYLPLFLALSASSPFFEGRDTGLASYRSKLFDSLPRSGMPDALGSWENYVAFVGLMKRCGIIKGPRDIWWDVRPSPEFGTIEIRICDVPMRFEHIMALCALIRATVIGLAEGWIEVDIPPRAVIEANKWQAARYGVDGEFIISHGLAGESGNRQAEFMQTSFRKAASDLIRLFDSLGSAVGLNRDLGRIRSFLECDTAGRLRKIYSQPDFPDMKSLSVIIQEFWQE